MRILCGIRIKINMKIKIKMRISRIWGRRKMRMRENRMGKDEACCGWKRREEGEEQ